MLPRELNDCLERDIPIRDRLYFDEYPVPKAVLDYADRQIENIKQKTKSPQDL